MKAKDRYHEHEGQWWFAERRRGDAETFPSHRKNLPWQADFECWWAPIDSVEITDALACSRAELGPVYVTYFSFDGKAIGEPRPLYAVVQEDGTLMAIIQGGVGVYRDARWLRIAIPDELKAVGRWEDK